MPSLRFLVVLFTAISTSLIVSAKPTKPTSNVRVYLIRHGEKPAKDSQPELSPEGVHRSLCVASLFSQPHYSIGKIIAQDYNKKTGARSRAFKTVVPLAEELDLKIDLSCDRDDPKCVKKLVSDWEEKVTEGKEHGNILICWEHDALTKIMDKLGVKHAPKYPGDRFDLIYEVVDGNIVSEESEHCSGLDHSVIP